MEQKYINDEKFIEAYNKLNLQQQSAVEHIEGAVMVIAGPGTGKTELLSLRVCNILRKTDTNSRNILCLTYTDSGVMAMRNRLVKYMGAEAYNVNIHTFHSFCARIISENQNIFSEYKELSLAEELDIIDVLTEMIDAMSVDHPIKRNTGERYYDMPNFKYVFEVMKRENWSPDYIASIIAEYPDYLGQLPEYQFKKNGEANPRLVDKGMKSIEFVQYAAPLLAQYNSLLRKRGLIDFDDAISMVVDKLKTNEDLRANYQEQFLYLLVDEYQDTNGAQNEILFQLTTHFQEPNLFVVGDDDQAIYRFQGASSASILTFIHKYNPQIYVLKNNYRSHQNILDASANLIQNNGDRLINRVEGLDKNLVQSTEILDLDSNLPRALYYQNDYTQAIGLIEEINKLYDRGVPYNDIAVIYHKHKHAEDIINYFAIKRLPYKVRKMVNVLDQKLIEKVLNLLKYISGESHSMNSKVDLLFEIMHYDFLYFKPSDVGIFTIHAQNESWTEGISWRQLLLDEARIKNMGLSEPEKFLAFHANLEACISSCKNDTPQVIFQNVIKNTGLLNHVLKNGEASWNIQLINKLFDYIKKVTASYPDLKLSDILLKLERMKQNSLSISISNVMADPDGVHFMTAHGAKGLEYRYVFILNVNEGGWSERGKYNKKFPLNLTLSNEADPQEELRRLMYVALTRAKEQVTLMVPRANVDEKPVGTHKFLVEMGIEVEYEKNENVNETMLLDYTSNLLSLQSTDVVLVDKNLLDQVLAKFKLNATALNKYLECKVKFYFENILRVPGARLATTGYGNAIHYALEILAIDMEKNPSRSAPSVQHLIENFERGMMRFKSHFNLDEYNSYLFEGRTYLAKGYNELTRLWPLTAKIISEHKVNVYMEEIPLTGHIDRIDVYEDRIAIFDYKTGKYERGKPKFIKYENENQIGGDYWRQIVFYKILLDLENKFPQTPDNGNLIYFKNDKDEYQQITIHVSQEEYEIVKNQIKTTYEGIKNHDFSNGCGECTWCKFSAETMHLDQSNIELDEDEDSLYMDSLLEDEIG